MNDTPTRLTDPSFEKSAPARPLLAWLALLAGWLGWLTGPAHAAVILQSAGSGDLAFEAEEATLIAGTPENWVRRNVAGASGGTVIVADGSNSTGDSPHSFAQFRIKFATQGTYYLYYRWKADETRTAGDVFTANSSWIGNRFGTFNTPGAAAQADYWQSDSNATQAPANNAFLWRRELLDRTYAVGPAEVAALQTLTIGTREAGMFFDRLALSTNPDLTPAQLDALVNAETDEVVQGAGEDYLAWEAETKATLVAGTPENWEVRADATANGGGAIHAAGSNSTGDSPHSFAQFRLKFATQGTYYLYYRWRAAPERTAGDVFTANSSWIGNRFGAFSTPGAAAQADYWQSDSNATQAPANNTYAWRRELLDRTYSVGPAEVAALQTLTIGTREAGMFFDRFVLATNPDLTPAQLDALINSGAKPPTPEIASAVGSATLRDVTVRFTRPLDPATVIPANFVLSGGVSATATELDAADARIVRLTTGAQAEGVVYTLTVSNVRDTGGTPVAAGTNARFTAWKRVNGWVTREIFFSLTGSTVLDLTASEKYLNNQPDRVEFVRGFQLNQDPLTDNYGARLTAFFQPGQGGSYGLFSNNDDEAELYLSSDASAANLVPLGTFPLSAGPGVFDDFSAALTAPLTAGQRYLLVGLLKQGGGSVYFNVAARHEADPTPTASLTALGGDRVSTFVNPDLGVVEFVSQPGNATATAGSRARFSVQAGTLATPVYYQWQRNGTDIPGAVRSTYVTPVLATGDSGAKYRCVVSVAGTDTPSAEATLTVNAGTPSHLQPFVGINFVGGGGGGLGGPLSAVDVAGVVPQENWNNLTGAIFDAAPLGTAAGAASPVTLTAALTETWYSGADQTGSADGALFQGFITAGASLEPQTLLLAGVPADNYQVLVYSLGFDFSADYQQVFGLAGQTTYPTYYGKAETGLPYVQSPGYRRMDSINPGSRPVGNYVLFDNARPAADGTFTLTVTWDSTAVGNTHQPAINAIQLVKIGAVVATPPVFSTPTLGAGGLTLTWTGGTPPFRVEHRATLAAGWTTAATVNDRTYTAPATADAGFYRIVDGGN